MQVRNLIVRSSCMFVWGPMLLGLLVGLPTGKCTGAEDTKVFQAGASKVLIETPLGMPIVGGWNSPPAEKVHDQLHVRCIVLDDGKTRIAFAICDSVGIPREVFDAARKLVDAKALLPSANVLMSATHTHSAVSARETRFVGGDAVLNTYQQLVARRITEAVERAVENLQPARIGWGSARLASEVHNRRWFVKDEQLLTNPFGGIDKVRMNPPRGSNSLLEPAGPVDPEISFVSIQSATGTPIALLANYSLHYVGGVPAGEVSADYFAAFSEKIGREIGGDVSNSSFVGIMTNGTSGDINNLRFREKSTRHEPYERIEQVSDLAVERVSKAHAAVTHQSWVRLNAATAELELKMRKPSPEMLRYFASLQDEGRDPKSIHRHAAKYYQRVQQLHHGPDTTKILLQAFRIGQLGITAIPFEVFAETGLDLKARSPFDDAFTIELANGSYGYLPTPAQHQLGGYETWMGTNRVQHDASEKISDVLLSLSQDLQEL